MGLRWPFRDMLATGCEDGGVRVYYVATSSDQPLKVFSGHTAKVFHVRWSPLREGILCSGSDDGCVALDPNFPAHLHDPTGVGMFEICTSHVGSQQVPNCIQFNCINLKKSI